MFFLAVFGILNDATTSSDNHNQQKIFLKYFNLAMFWRDVVTCTDDWLWFQKNKKIRCIDKVSFRQIQLYPHNVYKSWK